MVKYYAQDNQCENSQVMCRTRIHEFCDGLAGRCHAGEKTKFIHSSNRNLQLCIHSLAAVLGTFEVQ